MGLILTLFESPDIPGQVYDLLAPEHDVEWAKNWSCFQSHCRKYRDSVLWLLEEPINSVFSAAGLTLWNLKTIYRVHPPAYFVSSASEEHLAKLVKKYQSSGFIRTADIAK